MTEITDRRRDGRISLAARIYALAKELNLDSKVLVDLCGKAGLTGKGSALASLTDEEVVKVKAFVAAQSAPKAAPAPRPGPAAPEPPMTRPVTVLPTAPLPRIETPSPRRPEPAPAPPAAAATAKQPVAPPARPERDRPPLVELPKRPIAIRPTPPRPPSDGPKPPVPPRPAGPTIRFAPLPTAAQPTKPPVSDEPPPQKPDIKLPRDAIKSAKSGATPLQAHIKKQEIKRKAEAAKARTQPGGPSQRGTGLGGPLKPGAPGPLPSEGRGRRTPGKAGLGADARDAIDTAAGRDARVIGRKRAAAGRKGAAGEDRPRRRAPRVKRSGTNTAAPRKGNVVVELPCTIRAFSEAVGVPVNKVQGKLLALGVMATINSTLENEMVELLAVELGLEIEIKQPPDAEELLRESLDAEESDPESLRPRAPIVTFLGHVDHGKTSLLDKIIGIDVVSGESGGITQHIRAYRIEKEGRPIAFVDTPGHEAFTEMRARGANVTDIAVLVVAADDGVMPQTEEAISHAKAAEVPIVVALNKMDLPGINTQRIYEQLAANQLLPTEWGGDTEVVKCSALKGQGIDELLETLLTISELSDYKANPTRNAHGTCLEAEVHEGRGVVAKLLVQNGTLKVGDILVCGPAHGRVKAMYDTLQPRKTHPEAVPSMPVNVTGLDVAPGAGDHFYVLDDVSEARAIALERQVKSRKSALGGQPVHVTLETLHDRLGGDEPQTLNLILRADVRGSIEAIRKELTKLEHPEVRIKTLMATVGGISEADVQLAHASDAIIIGFNVVPDEGARTLADRLGVQIRRYEIIYQVTDDLKAALEGMLKPEEREVELGRALVQRTFAISRSGVIAGCRVLAGVIERNSRVRVIRESRVIGEYPLESLRREKDDAREVREGYECGMKLAGFNDVKEGDVLEAYRVEEIARAL